MLSKGEKVFVITRRLFEGDRIRLFVGEVQRIIRYSHKGSWVCICT